MPTTRAPMKGLLARVNFPLYAVEMLTARHILVAGGGGASNTGIKNCFQIYEIYFNGKHFCAEKILNHDTGTNVVMNFAVHNTGPLHYLCVGQESHCQMYVIKPRIECEQKSNTKGPTKPPPVARPYENGLRRRGNEANAIPHSGIENLVNESIPLKSKDLYKHLKTLEFDVNAGDIIQTEFHNVEPLQRVVRISHDGNFMATGGTDGILRLWGFPALQSFIKLTGHTKEIDDIDFSPDCKYVTSIAKDGQALVFSINGKLIHNLSWQPTENVKYLFKRCRYGTIECQRDKYRLYTISNPLGKVGKQRGYLQQWDSTKKELRKTVPIDESLAALAVRDDGRFVAIGTMFSGSVSIYIAFSMQRILHVSGAHSMFVTGLQFLPITSEQGPPISCNTEAAVLSISVDNKICIHSLPQRHEMPAWLAIILLISFIFATFVSCSYLGL